MPQDKKKDRKSLGQILRGEPIMEGMEEAGKTLSEMLFNDVAQKRYGDFRRETSRMNAYADPYEVEQAAAYMRKLKEVQDEYPRSESGRIGPTRRMAEYNYRTHANRAMQSGEWNAPYVRDGVEIFEATPKRPGVRLDPQYQEMLRARTRRGRPTY